MVNVFIDTKVLTTLGTALGLVLLDLFLGILLSIKQGNFDVRKLPQFLKSGVLPYLGSLLMLAIFAKSILLLQPFFIHLLRR